MPRNNTINLYLFNVLKGILIKLTYLTIFCLLFFIKGHAQNSLLDKIESSFERVIHTTAFPCHWKLQRIAKVAGLSYTNGSPLFVKDDSTRYEVEFFNAKKLPFYNTNQTNVKTSKAFYTWEVDQLNNQKEIQLTKPAPQQTDPFVILKIKTRENEFYRLIVTENEITYSIKIQAKGQPIEKQLEDLRLLGSLNINN